MEKRYKEENNELWYAEYWIDSNTITLHTGKVGKVGKTKEYTLPKDFSDEEAFIAYFHSTYEALGYHQWPEEKHTWILLQYPIKSMQGNKRDLWLKEKVTEYLNEELGWKGLGHVDGFDMGKAMKLPDQYVLNIFAVVVHEEMGIAAVKRCTRNNRLDYTQIKIATRLNTDNTVYELKYSAKKNDTTFSI